MNGTVKIAISLPAELLKEIDRERRRGKTTRSDYIRSAVRAQLEQQSEAALDEAYRRGYEAFPETEEELAWAEELRRRELIVPELRAVVILRVEAGGG